MLRLNLQRTLHDSLEAVRNHFFDNGNTEAGFLRLVGWFRFLVLLSLTFRFRFIPIDSQAFDDPEVTLLWVHTTLGIYFAIIIILRFLADFRPYLFESKPSKAFQIIVDVTVITVCYAATGYPHSDIFLLYFLPFLVVARYFETKEMVIFFFLVGAATFITWMFLGNLSEPSSTLFLVQALAFRLGFLFVVVTFYLVYQRRRRVIGQLGKAEDELLQRYQDLSIGLYHVDRHLKIKSMNGVMRQRHGLGLMNRPCYAALCHTSAERDSCPQCPLAMAMEQGREVTDIVVDFVDREGAIYQANVSAIPVFNGGKEVVGATAVVHDLGPRQQFENRLRSFAVDVERLIDTFITDNRKRTEEMTRQLEMLSRASAAVLSPNKPLRVDSIVKTMAELLRCQRANVRLYDFAKRQGEWGLLLHHSYGHLPEDTDQWLFLSLQKPGVATKVFQEGNPIQILDVQTHPDYVQYSALAHKFGVHAMASFPLLAEGNRLGTVSLYRNRREPFSPEEMNLGEALANNLAAAICNQKLVEHIVAEVEMRQKGLNTLSRISRQLVPHDDIHSLTQVLADLICEELEAEVSAVFLLEGDYLYRQAISGVEPNWFVGESYKVGQGITGRVVAENGRCVCENAVNLCPDVIPEHLKLYREHLGSGSVRHLLAVPLHGQHGIVGVLRVVNKLNGNRQLQATGFTQQDIALMQTIACIAAVAMENVRRLAEQRFLMDVGWAVTSSVSSAEILVESLNRAVEILDAEAGAVILPEKTTGDMIFRFIGGKGVEGLYGRKIPADKSITGQVFRSGKPILLSDATTHPDFYRPVDTQANFSTRSLLSVPIKAGSGIIGVLEILNKRRGTFTTADQRLLNALSAWVAIALENARLFEAEFEKRKLANVLLESTQVFSSTLNLEAILASMLGQLLSVVHYHRACVFLRQGTTLVLSAEINSENRDSDCVPTTLPIAQSALFQEIELAKRPYLLNDIPLEFNFDPIMNGGEDLRAWLGVPLVHRNDVLGLLTIDSRQAHCFAEDDVQIVSTFAQQAAIAISNADLFGQEKARTNELLVLNKSQVEITRIPSLAETADKIADCVIELLHCDFSGVALYNHDTKEIYALPNNGYRGVNQKYAHQFRFNINQTGGYVLRNRRIHTTSHVLSDVDSAFGLKFIKPIGVEAVMAAPLLAGEREIGILYAASQTPRDFTEDEKTIFSILANQAAVALRNAELFSETERRAELLELFHQISIAGQRTSDLDRIINIVLTGVTAEYGLRFNRALLLLVDPTGKYLKGYTGIGQTDKSEAEAAWAGIENNTIDGHVTDILRNGVRAWTPMHYLAQNLSLPIETDSPELFSYVCLTQTGLIVDSSEGKWLINRDFYCTFKPTTFALVPLSKDGEVIGMLVADKKFIMEPITKADLDLLGACANQTAAAIERARLHESVQSRIRELKHLQETTQDVTRLNDLQQVLRHIVKAANDVLSADVSYLVPYDAQSDKLLADFAAYYGTQSDFKHDTTYSRQGLTKLIMDEPSRLVVIEDLSTNPKLNSQFVRQEGVCSVALARLEFRGQVVGLLYVNYRQLHQFSDQEKRLLRMFADQAAIAIHNANLIKEYEAIAMQKERDRLREDMHDALNTFQFQVMLPLEDLRDEVKIQGHEEMAAELERVWQFSRHTNRIFHQIMHDMREPILLEKGLTAALTTFVSGVRETSNLDIDLQIVGQIRPTADIEHALYRICQEAMYNVTKHAYSSQATIKLILSLDMIHLTIDDDGIGFPPEAIADISQGMGLDSMRNWAKKVGSDLIIESEPGRGTHIEVLILPD